MLDGVHSGQGVEPPDVPCPEQIPRVAVERRARLGGGEQSQHGLAHGLKRPGWAPGSLQDVEAYLARLEVDVRVEDLRPEAHCGGHQRVVLRHTNVQLEGSVLVARVRGALWWVWGRSGGRVRVQEEVSRLAGGKPGGGGDGASVP